MISQPGNIISRLAAVLSVALLVSACSANRPAAKSPSAEQAGGSADRLSRPQARRTVTVGEKAAAMALQQVGVPYRYGGSTPRGFDCSGLVQYSWASAGVSLPRTTGGLWKTLRPVDRQGMRTGDLLFFNIDGKMSHVGLYLGQGQFVHAPSSGRVVSVEDLGSEFYRSAFIRAARPRQ